MHTLRTLCAGLCLLFLVAPCHTADVRVKLGLGLDDSGSIDLSEWNLQINGYIDAIADESIVPRSSLRLSVNTLSCHIETLSVSRDRLPVSVPRVVEDVSCAEMAAWLWVFGCFLRWSWKWFPCKSSPAPRRPTKLTEPSCAQLTNETASMSVFCVEALCDPHFT